MLKIKDLDGVERSSLNVIHDNLISFYKDLNSDYQILVKDKMEEYFMSSEYELHAKMHIGIIESVYNKSIVELNSFWKKELNDLVILDDFINVIKVFKNIINNIYVDGYKPILEIAGANSIESMNEEFNEKIDNPDICRIDILRKKLEENLIKEKKKEGALLGLNVYDYADALVQAGKYDNHLVLLEKLIEEKREFVDHIIKDAHTMSKEDKHIAVCVGINDIVGAYKAAEDYYATQGKIMKLFNRKARKFMKHVKGLILKSMTAIGYTLLSDDTFEQFVEYHSKSRTGHDFLEYKNVSKIVNEYLNEIYETN
ncbi:MAG: hypothetical protein K6A63_01200 [Acholeplasmatales bacterium]|nr:hypothetical protein [Acholeplasmatales bacterium]